MTEPSKVRNPHSLWTDLASHPAVDSLDRNEALPNDPTEARIFTRMIGAPDGFEEQVTFVAKGESDRFILDRSGESRVVSASGDEVAFDANGNGVKDKQDRGDFEKLKALRQSAKRFLDSPFTLAIYTPNPTDKLSYKGTIAAEFTVPYEFGERPMDITPVELPDISPNRPKTTFEASVKISASRAWEIVQHHYATTDQDTEISLSSPPRFRYYDLQEPMYWLLTVDTSEGDRRVIQVDAHSGEIFTDQSLAHQ